MLIEIPDINFPHILNEKAENIYKSAIGGSGNIHSEANGMGLSGTLIQRMETAINEVHRRDRATIIITIVQKLDKEKKTLHAHLEQKPNSRGIQTSIEFIGHMLHFLYNMLYDLGIDVTNDLFSVEEAGAITAQLDDVIQTISNESNRNNVDQEATNMAINRVEQLKDAVFLGKTWFKEKFIVFFVEYAGAKLFDAVLPKISSILAKYYPSVGSFVSKFLDN